MAIDVVYTHNDSGIRESLPEALYDNSLWTFCFQTSELLFNTISDYGIRGIKRCLENAINNFLHSWLLSRTTDTRIMDDVGIRNWIEEVQAVHHIKEALKIGGISVMTQCCFYLFERLQHHISGTSNNLVIHTFESIEREIFRAIREVQPSIQIDSTAIDSLWMRDLGFDELTLVEVSSALEETYRMFGLRIDDENDTTISRVRNVIAGCLHVYC